MPQMRRERLLHGVALILLSFPSCCAQEFRTGLEVLAAENFARLRGRRVAVLTNPTGVDRNLRSIVDLLASVPGVELVAIFGPEHGIRGSTEAGVKVQHAVHPTTGAPVYSLYGEIRRPTAEMLEGIEVLLYDLQDIGVRTYTYLATLVELMEAAAGRDLEIWVLDRPVPIGADRVEGPVLEAGRESFVGPHRVPLRHGLTAGEFARMANVERQIGARLLVVAMQGYERSMAYSETDLPWIAPSPNIPICDTALLYAGMVLVEGTNLSEGRGTTRPFHLAGAPWIDGNRLARELNRADLEGVIFRGTYFTPTFSKYRGEACSGVEVHITDSRKIRPVATAVALLQAVRRLYPDQLAFHAKSFDRLAGGSRLRQAIENGTGLEEILDGWKRELERYLQRRRRFLLYD